MPTLLLFCREEGPFYKRWVTVGSTLGMPATPKGHKPG